MRRTHWLLIALLAIGFWWWQTPDAPGVRVQGGQYRSAEGDLITPLADFEFEARVLGREDYRLDAGARLSPTDLALGWGPMANPAIVRQLHISQSNRWYFWRSEAAPPIPPGEIARHSANMHMIPANPVVARQLARVTVGQRIRLHGKLVRVDGRDGFTWVSSLSREDTGSGSCELVLLQALQLL